MSATTTLTTTVTGRIRRLVAIAVLATCVVAPGVVLAGPDRYRDPPEEPPWIADAEVERHRLTMEAETGTGGRPERVPLLVPLLDRTGERTRSRSMLSTPRLPRDRAPVPVDRDGDGLVDAWVPGAQNPAMQQGQAWPAGAAVLPPPGRGPSRLEALYSQRAGEALTLFGYDMFGPEEDPAQPDRRHDAAAEEGGLTASVATTPMGAIAEDVVLRSGDKVEVVFSGQRTDRDVHRVNAQGLLLIPDFPPIPAAGRSLADIRASIEAETASLRNTQVHVSVFSLREIAVLVAGHVREPGRQRLGALHTVLDALIAAGGVQRTGTLRNVTLRRGGETLRVDLYALLTDLGPEACPDDVVCAGADAVLQDGDSIIVPPLGDTVAVGGDVARPGIYELAPGEVAASLEAVLNLSGGVLAPGANRFMRIAATADGRETTTALTPGKGAEKAPQFAPGAILLVIRAQGQSTGQVRLAGHTRSPGLHVLARAGSLSALLSGRQVLGPDVYPLAAVLERRSARDLSPSWRLFSPRAVLEGGFDAKLAEGDIVHLFSRAQIMALEEPLEPSATAGALDCTAVEDGGLVGQTCRGRGEEDGRIRDPTMIQLLRQNAAFVRGGVRHPGPWPVAEKVLLPDLLATAGGVTRSADTNRVEITRPPAGGATTGPLDAPAERLSVDLAAKAGKGATVGPGDSVHVGEKRTALAARDTIWIGGEVRRPGTYSLTPGETVAGLIARAGGLTAQAYPAGAIFSRERARRAEEARYRAVAMDIEQSIALAVQRRDDGKRDPEGPNDQKMTLAQGLADQLRAAKGLGRVGIESRPDVLAAEPSLDVTLIAGDRLYIPPRPSSVRVVGEVLSPGFMPFRAGKETRDYIDEAAGLTFFGDKKRTFILYPDGTAQRLGRSSWNYDPVLVPPGSTIVVPRDPRPFDFIQTTRDLSTILANLAITTIFIDDVVNG